MTKKVVTNDGKKGGWLVGKRHYDKGGKPLGGIKAVVTDAGGKPVELEGGEVIINREASKKHWKELSRINQSAGNGVAIEPPSGAFDEDPSEDYENGGKIEFNANHIPNKWILNYAIKIKEEHPDVWALGGNIFGNQAFINLKRVAERGHWLDSEEWMYKKWRSFVARHKGDFRIQGVIAMLKWVDKVDKGWQYMKNLIEEEIKKREAKKSRKMSNGGSTPAPLKDRIKGSKFNEKGTASTSSKAESIKFDDKTIASIQSLIDAHNDKYPSKKITLAVAKAVVRRGMGAYSSSHRTTITDDKPNSRTAWGLARLKAFIYKAQTGKSKSGKYSQDNDLFEELNISVQKMNTGGLIAPNGKPSNLTPEQYKLVRTPEFKQWFGDWDNDPNNSSKVVDENGEPLVVYHGTKNKFYTFDKRARGSNTDPGIFGKGFYFSKNLQTSKNYGNYIIETFLNIRNPFNNSEFKNKSEVAEYLDISEDILTEGGTGIKAYTSFTGIFSDAIKEKGHDGVTTRFGEIVVFEPEQIKLADGTNTTFDGNNPDIRFDTGGDVRGMSWYSDFKKQQLKKGTEHELEHADTIEKFKKKGVSDRQVAEQIAKDHLEEDENYYIELDKMERKKFATGGLVTTYGGEANIGDKGKLNTRKGRIDIQITNITDKWVIFNDLTEGGKRKDTPRDKFIENYRGNAPLGSSVQSQQVASTSKPAPGKWTADDFKNTKIIVDTPEKSKKFQELLFSLGGEWTDLDVPKKSLRKKVHFTDEKYLLVGSDLVFFYFSSKNAWDDSGKKEIFYDDIFAATSTQQTATSKPAPGKWTANDFKNTKIIVDKEQSEKLQKYIFKLGGEWGDGSKKVELTSFEYMFIDDDLKMKVSPIKDGFDKDPSKQIFFDDIFKKQTTKSVPSTPSLNNYRIKTEAEFQNEFGTDWRSEVGWTSSSNMDWLFDKRLSEITVEGNEKDDLTSVLSNSMINTDRSKDPNKSNFAWSLNWKTWIYDPVSSEQTESKPEYVLKKPLKREDLYDIKITVDTPQKSEAFQKAAFNLGFSWGKGKQDIINTDKPYLFIDKEFTTEYEFTFDKIENSDSFKNNANKELYFDDLFELKGSKTSTIDVEPVVEKEKDVKSEKDLLVEQYNDVLFLISVTPTTDTENMLSLKARARELKDAIDLIDLELRKKAQTELTLLDELFDASTIKPQERYKFTPYSDGFAPDGQPTALPKNIYDWTMSEEFQNWFGNFTLAYNYRNSSYENVPCSVVVNKNYEPLIVYHGTGSEFSFFKFDSFPAMYFAENEAYSNWFAEMKGQQNGTQGYVYPFVLNIRTPLDLTLFETNKISATEFIDWMYLQTGLDENELKINKALLDPSLKNQAWVYLRNSPEMLKVLRDKNVCDGIIYYEDNPSVDVSSPAYITKAYIVFNANSAKIANNERHIQTIPAMRSFFLKRGGKL